MRPIHTKRRQRLNCCLFFEKIWRLLAAIMDRFRTLPPVVLAAIMESFLTLPFVPVAAIMDRFSHPHPYF